MAKKDETKKAAPQIEEATSENIMEQIRSNNLMKEANVVAALENIKKEEDEQQQREAQSMICKAKYRNAKTLIQLRTRRREEKITKETLTKTTNLLNEVLAGKITPTEYNDRCREIRREADKATRESNEEEKKNMDELRKSFIGNYAWSAEWEWN